MSPRALKILISNSMPKPIDPPIAETYPWRLQLPIYASGFFNGNVYFLTGILIPLWGAIIVKEPLLIGIIVASRQILPVLLSIHGGALMDRFGARKIMLIFGAIGTISMAAFPFFPFLSNENAQKGKIGLYTRNAQPIFMRLSR